MWLIFWFQMNGIVDAGLPPFVIPDHLVMDVHILPRHAIVELTLQALVIILPLQGEDITQCMQYTVTYCHWDLVKINERIINIFLLDTDPFHLEAEGIERGLTRGLLMARGAGVEVLSGAGAGALTAIDAYVGWIASNSMGFYTSS